ncbi:hypothetical protein L484_024036 [Morus notabilis]|uniref:Uncharacterized protein n=1 Tax=Morus notabilis TaxID=981085 RepID=W9RPL4_9ROSA|nr:uncharacterized protein LOC21406785 isoform X1 [Morus notabilis]EXC02071.1 hypothetical protein L484_024036 [Morus notabilis]
MENSSKSGMVITNQRRESEGIRLGNPFTLKVGQVFTGFGIGCGIGIGVGRPLNLGAIPVLNEVMSAARGATYAFSGVTRHVNDSFKKLGAKNIEAGIGCGVGIGHGFGVGLALKPSALHQIQFCIAQAMTKMMMKFGMSPNLPIGQGALPSSLQGGMSMVNNLSTQNPMGSMMQLATKLPDQLSQGLPGYENKSAGTNYGNITSTTPSNDAAFGTRTEKVLSSFLQNPIVKGEGRELNEVGGRLRSENDMLYMVLKHQQVIEELKEENEKLRQILVEELKIPPAKLQTSYSSTNQSPCSDCFECRRRQRKK